MPLTGEYKPSPSAWARKQAELYEATNGEEGAELRGRPVIVLTSVGAKTGKLRKTPSCGSSTTASTRSWRHWAAPRNIRSGTTT
jgi:hypothetical protein